MAERRMFAKTIIDSDAFLDMPTSSQALYFHLAMRADDEGFINNPKKVQRIVTCSDDDMKLLVAKKFIIPFESGIVVVKHWRIHNYIRGDRLTQTVYRKERELLSLKDNESYTLNGELSENCQSDVRQLPVSCPSSDGLGKVRLGKDRLNIYSSVIAHLNLKAGTNYRQNCGSTTRLIDARLNDGFTEQDFFTVIDKKCADWIGTEQEQYLRPQTLFGTKFEGYLNSKVSTPQQKRNAPNIPLRYADD